MTASMSAPPCPVSTSADTCAMVRVLAKVWQPPDEQKRKPMRTAAQCTYLRETPRIGDELSVNGERPDWVERRLLDRV